MKDLNSWQISTMATERKKLQNWQIKNYKITDPQKLQNYTTAKLYTATCHCIGRKSIKHVSL